MKALSKIRDRNITFDRAFRTLFLLHWAPKDPVPEYLNNFNRTKRQEFREFSSENKMHSQAFTKVEGFYLSVASDLRKLNSSLVTAPALEEDCVNNDKNLLDNYYQEDTEIFNFANFVDPLGMNENKFDDVSDDGFYHTSYYIETGNKFQSTLSESESDNEIVNSIPATMYGSVDENDILD
ncbi:hypothetical protein DAMA08_052320 [Martiniozyma asiatica (nom. inval.)]|nr:hypothetical protein DAMA08_052320 [Martiniozyma asiatica]